ncbi:MAG: hypothetical protein KY475_05960 [Planctomycetes bacterium]|nr:hypothetical protein [Planctomycetota bacterium]
MNARLALLLLAIITAAWSGGCGREEPPSDPQTFEAELEQLNEHRQREWNNQ